MKYCSQSLKFIHLVSKFSYYGDHTFLHERTLMPLKIGFALNLKAATHF